ncbi:unnamed protein product [Prunus armeniaca]
MEETDEDDDSDDSKDDCDDASVEILDNFPQCPRKTREKSPLPLHRPHQKSRTSSSGKTETNINLHNVVKMVFLPKKKTAEARLALEDFKNEHLGFLRGCIHRLKVTMKMMIQLKSWMIFHPAQKQRRDLQYHHWPKRKTEGVKVPKLVLSFLEPVA